MPRIGLDFALDSLGGGLGGGILCDFSTYFNGLLNVNVDFIQRAPLHIDTVGVTNDAVTADVAFDFEVDEEFTITFRLTEQTANDKLFVIYDTGTTIEISLVVDTGTYFPTIEIFNGASTVVCDGNANLVLGQQYTIGFRTSGAITTKLFEMLIDGVAQTDTELVNVTGGTADKVYIGTSVALTDVTKMELFSQSSVQLGNVNFVSNVSDGLNFNSTNGDTYIASDQSPLTIQYPNYPPLSEDIVSSPATGPLNLIEDSLDNPSLALVNLDQNWEVELKINIDVSASVSDRLLRLESGSDSSSFTLDVTGTSIRLFITDSIASLQANMSRPYTKGTDAIVTVTRTGSSVTLDVNGSSTTDATVDLTTNGCAINEITVGAEDPDFREIPAWFYYCNIDIIDNWYFVGRLWTQTDPNGNKFIGSVNGIELALKDDAPISAVYPYYSSTWPTAYLESDTQCPDNDLVTNNNIAVTNNGEFVFNTP